MRNTLILLMTAAIFVSCGQKKRAHIAGTLTGLSNDTLLLEEITTRERKVVDSVVTNDKGDFRFTVELPVATPTFYNLIHTGFAIPLLVSPGERITVNSLGDLARNYTVEGSPDSKLLKEFTALYQSGIGSMDSLSELYAQTRPAPQYDERRKELLRAYTQAYLKFKREHIAFIVKNATSLAAIYALYQHLPNDEPLFNAANDYVYYRMVADSLSSRYPESTHVIALIRDVEAQQKSLELANKINEMAANQTHDYPEIDLRDIYDKQQLLSAQQGKVVLIDFWSTADTRSGVLNAEYKELYEQYAPKGFEVYQVSLGDNKADWVNTVLQQRLPWISVLDPNGLGGASAASYRVQGVPANILIDKQGRIAGRNYFGAALKTKVADLTR